MSLLIAGMVVFFGMHMLPWRPDLKAAIVRRIGELPFKGLFAIVSGAGLALMIVGYAASDKTFLWAAPAWAAHLAWLAVPIAWMLVAAAYVGSNIKRVTAHPMLWGVALWSAVHLLNNGDTPSLLLFGGFLVYALAAMASANRRGAVPSGPVPFWRDAVCVALGLAAGALFAHFHEGLFGVAVMP